MTARALAQLNRPAAQRDLGGHGDLLGFMALVEATAGDLFEVELPQPVRCSTCRFLTADFHARMPCWDCVTDARLPKWRPRAMARGG